MDLESTSAPSYYTKVISVWSWAPLSALLLLRALRPTDAPAHKGKECRRLDLLYFARCALEAYALFELGSGLAALGSGVA